MHGHALPLSKPPAILHEPLCAIPPSASRASICSGVHRIGCHPQVARRVALVGSKRQRRAARDSSHDIFLLSLLRGGGTGALLGCLQADGTVRVCPFPRPRMRALNTPLSLTLNARSACSPSRSLPCFDHFICACSEDRQPRIRTVIYTYIGASALRVRQAPSAAFVKATD